MNDAESAQAEAEFAAYLSDFVAENDLTFGKRLPNGATIIAARDRSQDLVVLANFHGGFVTWIVDPDNGEAFWGHYFEQDIAKAVEDYLSR